MTVFLPKYYCLSREVRTGTSAYNRAYNADGEGNRITQNFDGASRNFIYDKDGELTGIHEEETFRSGNSMVTHFAFDIDDQMTDIIIDAALTQKPSVRLCPTRCVSLAHECGWARIE